MLRLPLGGLRDGAIRSDGVDMYVWRLPGL